MRTPLLTIGLLFALFAQNAYAQATKVAGEQALVSLSDTGQLTINKNIYGQFAEHLGRCVYDGIYKDGQIRPDIVAALKEIKVPLLRWPGGCFADQYHWRDGIGDKKKRPKTVNTTWGMVTEDNSFGTTEFMQLCKKIGCEPYIAGNMGTGTPQEMKDWLEYLNFDGNSTLAGLRKANGQAAPYHVKFWGVGNESWGCGGRMTAEDYANKYREFANFCKSYPGSPLQKMVSGANADDYHWTQVVMSSIPLWLMQGIGVHYYTLVDNEFGHGSATSFDEEQYFRAMKNALFIEEIINNHAAIMDRYDPGKKVMLAVDEWGISLAPEPSTNPNFLYQQNSLRDALIAASTLNIFNNHCDRIRMANLAQAVNVLQALILTKGRQMLLTPTYYVFDLYKVHQDAKWLPIKLQTPDYNYQFKSIPAVNASASMDSAGTVHMTLVNLDPHQSIRVQTELPYQKTSVSGEILTSEHFTDINTFEQPGKIKPVPFTVARIEQQQLHATLPPLSVVLLSLK
jgi:alpha-N-arabinofuranosidase